MRTLVSLLALCALTDCGRRAHDSPPMWTSPFIRPRDAVVTSRFTPPCRRAEFGTSPTLSSTTTVRFPSAVERRNAV